MEQNNILLSIFFSFFLGLIILYWIIQSATKSNEHIKLLKIQIRILQEIALKSGVEQEKLNDIVDKNS